MKICASNPLLGEYTICGDAFDLDATDTGAEEFQEFRMSKPGDKVTCEQCLSAIAEIYRHYTPKGKMK